MQTIPFKLSAKLEARILLFAVLGPHTSNSPCSPHYQGSGPSSEVEVKNVLKYLESIQDTLVGFFDIHAFGQYIFHPWAYTDREAPDFSELVSRFSLSSISYMTAYIH